MRRRFSKVRQMSSIKLDPSFNRQTKPGRVGGFQPPTAQPKPEASAGRFLYLVTVAAIAGATIVVSYFWLLREF
jgi:hypothetical protein